MIKFFRKFRKNLLSEGKTGRYLKYAIGEIILVVIGILIAVQINSFVNKSKLEKDNEIMLESMISELELNKRRMYQLVYTDTKNISLEKAVKNCDTFLNMTYRGLNKDDLPFLLSAKLEAGGSYLNIHNSIYEELLNTGKLYTLGSNSIIKPIKEYYKLCEREHLYNTYNSKMMYDALKSIDRTYGKLILDYTNDSSNFDIGNYPWYFDKRSQEYQDIQIALNSIKDSQVANLNKMNAIYQYSDSLITIIQTELNNNY